MFTIKTQFLIGTINAVILTGVAAYAAIQQRKLNTIIDNGYRQQHEDVESQIEFMRKLATA